jgi:hypothetical protein
MIAMTTNSSTRVNPFDRTTASRLAATMLLLSNKSSPRSHHPRLGKVARRITRTSMMLLAAVSVE